MNTSKSVLNRALYGNYIALAIFPVYLVFSKISINMSHPKDLEVVPHPQNIFHINNDVNINMNIDIHIIINMDIEDYIEYYSLIIKYALLAIPCFAYSAYSPVYSPIRALPTPL